MFAWGLDEIAEGVGVIYVFIIGLLVLLVKLEQGLPEAPKPRTRLVRQLSRQWVSDVTTRPDPVIAWLSHSRSWNSARLSRKLHISPDDAVRLLRLAGYHETRSGQWSAAPDRRRPSRR